MRIHALMTGHVAVKTRQREGTGRGVARFARTLLDRDWTEPLPILAWVIDHPDGVLVVDTGETARTAERGYFPPWHPYFRLGVKEWVRPEDEIGPQLEGLGIHPDEVTKVVLTHLHTDHAGGLHHFPNAEVVLTRREHDAAVGFRGKLRGYLPHRWPTGFRPTRVEFTGPAVGPFAASVPLTPEGDVVLVPTPGHSPGHASVIVQEAERRVFLAGDVSYTQDLLLRQAVDGVTRNEAAARDTLARTLRFAEGAPTVYLPSHDPDAPRRLASREAVPSSATATRRAPGRPVPPAEVPA